MLKKKLVKQNNSVEVLEDFSPLKEVTDHLVSAESLLEQGKVDDAFIDFGVAVAKADKINQMEVREQVASIEIELAMGTALPDAFVRLDELRKTSDLPFVARSKFANACIKSGYEKNGLLMLAEARRIMSMQVT